MMLHLAQRITMGCLAAAMLACSALAEDWPAYKKDAQRSSITAEALAFPLARVWDYQPGQPPQQAWPEPGKELNRVDFDYAFQPVAAGGIVYFGSSADDTVRALNADTGELVWRFVTEGPVRFAPAIARGRAYVVSDDGWLYCLDANTGALAWRVRAAPDDDRILGNGRLIARYPCRSGLAVVDGVVYLTAGMWPTEGVYVYALDADTGKELWCNDSSGSIYIDLPHAVANGLSGVAPQGYILASGDYLIVPTGRSVPAGYDRRTGRLLYYKPEKTHYHFVQYGGGVWLTASQDVYFNPNNRFQNPSQARVGEADPSPQDGMVMYSFASGEQQCHIFSKYRCLAANRVVYAAGNGSIGAIDLSVMRRKKRIREADFKWSTPLAARVYCMAMAGGAVLTGNRDSITAFNAADGKSLWRADIKGQEARGLAIAGGRLIVATNSGALLCFGSKQAGPAKATHVKEEPRPSPRLDEQERKAKEIVQRSGKSEGYALVVGEPDSRLAEALARQTQLHVICAISNASAAAAERERLLDAGLLGSRVAVHAVQAPSRSNLPEYFADLVVVSTQAKRIAAKECYRALRPCGGALCLLGMDDSERKAFVRNAGVQQGEASRDDRLVRRGKLPGAGDWRYPWADGGRSGVGKESRVRFPVKLLWFGGPGPGRLVDRHLMTSPPISVNGRVFMEGQNDVIAFDAYNGRELWDRHVENVGRKYAQYYSSSLVADDDSVYVVQSDKCHRIDQATGKIRSTYSIPAAVTQGTPPPEVPEYLDIEWPKTWRVLGPFPKGKPPLSKDALKTVPDSLTVNDKEYVPREVEAVKDIVDFTTLFEGYGLKPLAPGEKPGAVPRRGRRYSYHDVGRICYAFAKVACPKSGKLLIGAGADWGMRWFLDGEVVFDALKRGSIGRRQGYFTRKPCSPTDVIFDVDASAGEHVLAVMVTAGSRGWAVASASMAKDAAKLMPVATGANPNVPDLKDLVWGYLSVAEDLLLGSYNVPVAAGQSAESHLLWRSESKAVFALNKADGSLRWVYRAMPGRIVTNIEIAFGDGRLFLIDGTSKADLARARRRESKIKAKLTLVALNLADGSELWRQDDVPLLGDRTILSRLKTNITHLFMGQPSWGHLTYANGTVVYGADAAYDAATGAKRWQKRIRPGKLPIIYRDRIITSSCAYDLGTGKQRMTQDPLTGERTPWRYQHAYGCGPVMGCQHVLFFRAGVDGFFDMEAEGATNFGAVRSGCARTLLAANGLLLHPQGYSGCSCCYNFKTNLALVSAPETHDVWYVFPRRVSSGLIKRIAVNFGAPGDRKDSRGHPWLGFPRPMLNSACPAPVTVSMSHAAHYYRRRATALIQGTDSPWVYSSGLRGQGRIAVDLALRRGPVMPVHNTAPAIDGKLDDPCWRRVPIVPFNSTAFSMLGAAVQLRMFRDGENIYFGYCRRPIAYARTDADRAVLGDSDELDIFLADRRRAGIHFVIKRNGNAVAKLGTVGVSRRTDPKWKGKWECAVQDSADGWTAELAVPIKTLTQCGMTLKRLRLNAMSRNLTQSGPEAVFLTDPYYGDKFRRCSMFLPIVKPPAQPLPKRSFTVRLHFAETAAGVKAGQRVFDVAIQGKTVLAGLDIVRDAGGPCVALVKEVGGVVASDQIVVELTAKRTAHRGHSEPIISALEVIEEK